VSDLNVNADFFPLDGQLFCEKLALLIKQKRLDRQLRQEDLAQAIGSSLSTIKRIERGDKSVEYGVVIKALWYLGILDQLNQSLPEIEQKTKQRRIRLAKIDEDNF
jgi:transcriptional regulator with XRE-family HTH domain